MSTETHPCYFRGCDEIVPVGQRYCDRHQAINEKRKADIARRASERAAQRRESTSRPS
jgi:hypothetical protein